MQMFLKVVLCIFLWTGVDSLQSNAQAVPNAPQPQAQTAPLAPPIDSLSSQTACASFRRQSALAISHHDYAAAVVELRKAVPACSNRNQVLIDLAKAEMLSRQFDSSASTLRDVLAHDPHNVEALIVQGELLYLVGKSTEAITSLKQAIAAAPRSAEPHYLLGRIYYEESSLQLARVEFQQALQLDADSYKAYDGLALCDENLGDVGEAAQTYMKGIAAVYKAHPEYGVIYADFAELMLRFNESQKALELAAEAVQRNPDVPRDYLLAGRALEQSGKDQDSLRWLLRAAQMDPAYPDPHLQLARVYRRLGDVAKAKQEAAVFNQLLAKAPAIRR
jgi:predicted Zn-dependent protease